MEGKRVRKSFGQQKKVAELYLKNVEVKMAKGEELSPKYEFISLDDFIAKYLQYCRDNKSTGTYRTDLNRIKTLRQFLQSKGIERLEGTTPAVIEELRSLILQNSSGATFNHYLTLIKAMRNKAEVWRYLRENPLKDFRKLKSTNAKRVRFLTPEEISAILANAGDLMQSIMKILLYTGMRRSELVYLTWDDVDFHNKLTTIQSQPEEGFHPKSRRPRSIPINPEPEQLLLDLPQEGRYIFDNCNGKPKHSKECYTKRVARILESAGVRNANLHTLRHTFASHLVMNGVDLRTVQELLGHSTITMTEQHSHLSPDHRTRAVNRLSFRGDGTTLTQNEVFTG